MEETFLHAFLCCWVLFYMFSARTFAFSPPEYSFCTKKDFSHGGTVCVCSEQHCDSFSEGIPLSFEQYAVYTSSKAGDRFSLRNGTFSNKTRDEKALPISDDGVKLTLNSNAGFQKILGFGGAFTGIIVLDTGSNPLGDENFVFRNN